jgi:predicted transcriptional regulator
MAFVAKGTQKVDKGIRQRILQLLKGRPRTIPELVNLIGVTPNTVYVYLWKLRSDGLIEDKPRTFSLK